MRPVLFYYYPDNYNRTLFAWWVCLEHGLIWAFYENGFWTAPPGKDDENIEVPFHNRAKVLSPEQVLRRKWVWG
jgi:hypothetical protein